MHSYVVVSAKPGRTIPAHLVALLTDPSPEELPFAPEHHLTWQDRSSRLRVAGWQADTAHLGLGSHWEVRPSGLTAFSGHVWCRARSWDAGTSWGSQLADVLARLPLQAVATELDGVYTALSLDADGRGCITADPLGIAMLYRAETADVVVVANRAALAARAVTAPGATPSRDVEAAAGMAYAGHLPGDRTGFTAVRVLPAASRVLLHPERHPRVQTWSEMPWVDDPVGSRPVADAVEEATEHLRALVHLYAAVPAWLHTNELTGGHDSRLVLSLLLSAGTAHDFVHVTWGSPDLPDVRVAADLADRYGLALRAAGRPPARPKPGGGDGAGGGVLAAGPDRRPRPRRPAQDHETQLREHVWATSGARSIWDLWRPAAPGGSPSLATGGQLGGVLRTAYGRSAGLRSMADLERYVRCGALGRDGAGLLRADVRHHHDDLVVRQLARLRPDGGTPQDAADGLYQQARLRRWFGSGQELDRRNRVFPLYSMPAIRAAFAIGSTARRAEVLHLGVMLACRPELARLPFAGPAWPEEALAHLGLGPDAGIPTAPPTPPWSPEAAGPPATGGRRRRLARRRPARRGSASAATVAVDASRMDDYDAKRAVLRSLLDQGRGHVVFDLLDRRAALRAVDDAAGRDFMARRAVHDAVTAAMWLGGEERPIPRHERP